MAKDWTKLIGRVELGRGLVETASVNGAEKVDARLRAFKSGFALAVVTAVSGTSPTLDLKVQGRQGAAGAFADLGTFAQITAVGSYLVAIDLFREGLRYASTIAGTTPSFSYSIYAFALEQTYLPDIATAITA